MRSPCAIIILMNVLTLCTHGQPHANFMSPPGDRIRGHAIDSAGGDQQCQHCKGAEQQESLLAGGQGFTDALLHGFHIRQGQASIDCENCVAQRRGVTQRVRRRSQHNIHKTRRSLQIGRVQLRCHSFAEAEMVRICYHTYHGLPGIFHSDPFSHCVLCGKKRAGQALVENHNLRRPLRVALVEEPA